MNKSSNSSPFSFPRAPVLPVVDSVALFSRLNAHPFRDLIRRMQDDDLAFLQPTHDFGLGGRAMTDLDIAPAAIQATAAEGDTITHSLSATNHGPNAASSVQVTISANLPLVSATSSLGSCVVGRNVATCQIGTLAAGATVDVDVTLSAVAGVTARVLAGVEASNADPVPGNNSTQLFTAVTPVASILMVTNANNSGPGSLREAINIANLDAGPAVVGRNVSAVFVENPRRVTRLRSGAEPREYLSDGDRVGSEVYRTAGG